MDGTVSNYEAGSEWIITASGKRFYLRRPTPADIDAGDVAHALAHICRFNGHTREFYSVAQHSILVSRLLPDELKLAGLLHDAAEAYCGDMVKPLKNCLKDFAEYEDAVWRVIAARFNVSPELLPEVKKADRIALAAEMRDLFGQEVTIDQPARDVADRLVPGIVPLNPTAAKLKFAQELDRLQSERLQ